MANGDLNPTFEMQPQQQTLWCWSATAASIGNWFAGKILWSQCCLADKQLGETTCCQDGSDPLTCNKTSSLHTALQTTGNLDYSQDSPIPFTSVQTEINDNLPVGARVEWANGGGAHVVAITGWYQGVDPSQITVMDSFYGTSLVDFSTFQTSYKGSGTWTHTYITQA